MSIHLLSGDDESVLRDAVHDLVHRLVGDGDRSLMVDEFDGAEYELRAVVDAAQTLPMFTERRVVVARGVGRFVVADLDPLLAYLSDPLETTDLVLVGDGGAFPKKGVDAVKAAGGAVRSTTVAPRAKDRTAWIRERATMHGIDLDDRAVARLQDWMGDEVSSLEGVLTTIAATHEGRARVKVDEIEPLLDGGGGVPPWELTDAIDAARTADAIRLLHRMMHGGGRHPLQIMATLHGHYASVMRLDGSGAGDAESAAAIAGVKSGFPAKKLWQRHRSLDAAAVRRAIDLLATADRNLRGETGLDEAVVMEVLVARLSRLRA